MKKSEPIDLWIQGGVCKDLIYTGLPFNESFPMQSSAAVSGNRRLGYRANSFTSPFDVFGVVYRDLEAAKSLAIFISSLPSGSPYIPDSDIPSSKTTQEIGITLDLFSVGYA